jgi:hypothetical protein
LFIKSNNLSFSRYNNIKLTGLSIVPLVLFFGYFLSNIGLRLPILSALILLLLSGYIFASFKIKITRITLIFVLFFAWGTILLVKGNAEGKLDKYMAFIMSFLMMISAYYYGLYTNTTLFKYYIYVFIFASFVIAFLEVNFDLIMPFSVKYKNTIYRSDFKNIPTSTFYNANDFASAIGIVFVYIYSYCSMMKYKTRFLLLFCCLYIIFFTGSRGVQIAILLMPLVYSRVNKTSFFKLSTVYVLGLLALMFLLKNTSILNYTIGKYLYTANSLNAGHLDSSSLSRWQMIFYTFTHLKEVLIGFGPGGSEIFLGQFPIPNPHNFFMEILIDYGILGLLLSLMLFAVSLKTNYYILTKGISKHLCASCKATIILTYLFILFTVVSSSLFNYWPYAWFPVYLSLMHIGAYNKQKKNLNVL